EAGSATGSLAETGNAASSDDTATARSAAPISCGELSRSSFIFGSTFTQTLFRASFLRGFEVPARLLVVGSNFERFMEMGDCLVEFLLLRERSAQVIVRFRIARIDFNGLLKMANRFIHLPAAGEGHAQVVMRFVKIRPD